MTIGASFRTGGTDPESMPHYFRVPLLAADACCCGASPQKLQASKVSAINLGAQTLLKWSHTSGSDSANTHPPRKCPLIKCCELCTDYYHTFVLFTGGYDCKDTLSFWEAACPVVMDSFFLNFYICGGTQGYIWVEVVPSVEPCM